MFAPELRQGASPDAHGGLDVTETTIENVLTRTTGYLRSVTSHSLQPYCGCAYGNALCGVGCYVKHNGHLLKGRRWGGFLEVRTNAADSYRTHYDRERRWARRLEIAGRPGDFSIFCSSATDPFVPQERRFGVTRSILEAMCDLPPDRLILQTHSHRVADYIELYRRLMTLCDLKVHVSIETDRERIEGLPPHASSVEKRMAACAALKEQGIWTVVTVSPLLPIERPREFFARIAEAANAVVIDHFIGGDGTSDGRRTLRTALPEAMRRLDPDSLGIDYRDRMVAEARRLMPERVGMASDGFAGRYL